VILDSLLVKTIPIVRIRIHATLRSLAPQHVAQLVA